MKLKEFIECVEAASAPVILTGVNAGYVRSEIVENWYQSAVAVGLRDHIVVVGFDDEALDLLAAAGIPCCPWNSDAEWDSPGAEAVPYRTDGWKEIVHLKLLIAKAVLDAGRPVIFSDADIVFCRNPVENLLGFQQPFVIQAGAAWDQVRNREAICSGFYFAKPTQDVINLLLMEDADFVRYAGDQDVIRDRLIEGVVDQFAVLSPDDYPNGSYWMHVKPPDPYLIHFNWLVGLERKVHAIKESGNWLIG